MATAKKQKRRRVKHMEGLLTLARLPVTQAEAAQTQSHAFRPVKRHVLLQPQLLQVAFSAQDDQEMQHMLGRIDLRGAMLEQVPDGFIIHEAAFAANSKKYKLQDPDKVTMDAWFYGVYATITEAVKLPIEPNEDMNHQLSAIVSSSVQDDVTDLMEFELSCQMMLPNRSMDKPSIKWKVWKSRAQLQAFDDEIRPSLWMTMKRIEFPRERKRDSLFGLRKKANQEQKEHQLAVYVETVFSIPDLMTNPTLMWKAKQFLGFDYFFEIKTTQSTSTQEDRDVDAEVDMQQPQLQPHQSQLPELQQPQQSQLPELQQPQTMEPVFEPPQHQVAQLNRHPSSVAERLFSSAPDDEDEEDDDMVRHELPRQYYSAPEPVRQSPVQEQPVHEVHHTHFEPSNQIQPMVRSLSSMSWSTEDEGEEHVEIIPETDPVAAKKLHKQVLKTVRELVNKDEERVRDFQDQTKDFGREKTTATEYCAFLLGAVGSHECCRLIPMMARILPDEEKRAQLMAARAAIWRRHHRRNRRRSKQFSESVVMQQQRFDQPNDLQVSNTKLRPKSESLATYTKHMERQDSFQRPQQRSSLFETSKPALFEDTASVRSSEGDRTRSSSFQTKLLDPRRKLENRRSFISFSEAPADPIQEENPASYDSDNNEDESNPSQIPNGTNGYSSGYQQASGENNNEMDSEDGDEHYRAKRSLQRRSSLKAELEAPHPAPVEENPVLARLRKQGAINFMMR